MKRYPIAICRQGLVSKKNYGKDPSIMIINLNALGLSSKADLEARVELIISISTVDLYHGAVHAARTAIVVLNGHAIRQPPLTHVTMPSPAPLTYQQ